MSQRTDRVDELLRQEIGQILAKELADPRIGFATITDVETAPDLRHAKVWVSVIGGKTDRTETVRALQASMGFVRHELGKRLRIKRIPALHIHLDDTAERGTRVLHLLQELESGVDPQEVTPFNESLPTPVKRLPHEGDAEPEEDVTAAAADTAAAPDTGGRRDLPAIPPAPSSGRRPAKRHGPRGVDRANGGSRPSVPRRKPGSGKG
jgi:ribosome-binding factor A